MTHDERTAARKRCEAATPPPWTRFGGAKADASEGHHCRYATNPELLCSGILYAYERHRGADLEFAAYARTDLPAALDEIDNLEQSLSILAAGTAAHYAAQTAKIDRLEALLRSRGIDPDAA